MGFRFRGHSQNTEPAFLAPKALAVYLFEC
jgi:hypothetical protein